MIRKIIFLFAVIMMTSCVGYYYTESGGVRVNNPKVFKYNKKRYTLHDKAGIDTNAIYLLDSTYNKWNTPKWRCSNNAFVRFFSTGQVLFVYCDSKPTLDEINNPELGTPGYYIVKGTKVKVDMFQNLNGGQTGKYYGRIKENGDLIFFEQRPETYYSSFELLENAEGDSRFSIWKKKKIENLKNYRPNW